MTLTPLQKWRVLELSGEVVSRSPNAPAYPSSSLKPFFDWQFRIDGFDFAIIAKSTERFIERLCVNKEMSSWLNVIVDVKEAQFNQNFLERKALEGFLLVGIKSTADEVKSFFAPFGYVYTGEALLGDGTKFDLLGTKHDKQLIHAIALASKMSASTICCFYHDADPVYILLSG